MAFDHEKSLIRRIDDEGKESELQIVIDTFALSVFGLLITKGSNKTKLELLFDMVLGLEGIDRKRQIISWKNSRLYRAF